MSVFSERLKNAIDVCGVSISILAERSGMSASMLYKIQSGSRLPDSLETLELLLDAMLCDLPRKTDLIQTYKIERIGNLRYASFMALKNMLAEMADPAPVSQEPRVRGPVQIPDVIVGKETIDLFNTSDTRGMHPSYGTNYQKTGKQLMSQDEIAVMDGGKCILQLRGVRPFLSDKYDITKHKQYHKLSDYDRRNEFNIEKYVKNRNHATIKPADKVDEAFDAGEVSA